jgi:hypothetical protein
VYGAVPFEARCVVVADRKARDAVIGEEIELMKAVVEALVPEVVAECGDEHCQHIFQGEAINGRCSREE